jgi:RNA polymerase sigma-70 factor (ECF subfamily)
MTGTHPGTHADAVNSQLDDARVIELSLRDPARFGAIFDRYFAEIHGYAAKRAGREVADDIAAETFLTAFWARRRFDPGRGTVKAWLYGIVTNHLSAYRRRELRAYRAMARSGLSAPDEGHADRVVERVAAGSLRGPLAKALADLSCGERDVLLLVALGDLSNTDVAAALGIPYGTVASRLSRARAKLRKVTGIALALDQEDRQ